MGKGEIAHCEQFLLFPQCFQKTCTAATKKGLFWKGLSYKKKSRITLIRYKCEPRAAIMVATNLKCLKRQVLDSSKLKVFPDDNFKFDENARKFSKSVENAVGKGEIARYEQFLLSPQCFQKTLCADT